MKPLKNYILVVETEKETTTAGGIVLAGDAQLTSGSKPGVAVAVGPDVVDVKAGDTIAVKWSDSLPVTVKGEKAVLLCEDAVYGIY